MTKQASLYPPISDYAFLSDCRGTALVSRAGSIDWCCMPRIDSDSCFGRLLDWEKGGYAALFPDGEGFTSTRRYLPGTMIVETRFSNDNAEVLLYDFFAMQNDPKGRPWHALFRIVEGVRGEACLSADIGPRFDYGEIIPRFQFHREGVHTAVGGNKAFLIRSDCGLEKESHEELSASFQVAAGQRKRMMIRYVEPESLGELAGEEFAWEEADACLENTRARWEEWTGRMFRQDEIDAQTVRSAVVLKALMYEPTGAIAAAATTSLPESIGAQRNWDYRFSWVRDSVFAVRALYALGYEDEAARFLRFIQRCSAGSAEQLQIMYAVDGKRRLTEIELGWLEGYRQSRPVRIGNQAYLQSQLDVFGEIIEVAWLWHSSGRQIDRQYWEFLKSVIDTVSVKWREHDHGIWEFRGRARHYVHSKVMCWAALDHGLKLAQENDFDAPLAEWVRTRDAIRHAIESKGYDEKRGIFTQAFDSPHLDASLLLMPRTGFIENGDPRMLRTTDAIRSALERNGLLERYDSPDNLSGHEGIFLPCTFWLVACLAYQGRRDLAERYYRKAIACANDVGLMSEEFDEKEGKMLGNFPQVLTHVSQIVARMALDEKPVMRK